MRKSIFGRFIRTNALVASILCSLLMTFGVPMRAAAATVNTAAAPKVSFTFDDGLASSINLAAPTLAKYGFSGTNYVTTGCIGMTTVPNTCKADTDKAYMTWAQVKQLQTTYGWEIGSHTATHPLLASTDAEVGQTVKLTAAQVKAELENSKAAIATNTGIAPTAFAAPFGDYDMPVLAEVAKNYSSLRGFADIGYNTWPNNDYLLRVQQVQTGVSVATVKTYIDNAIKNNQWLILVFHDIKARASSNPDDYEYSTANLDKIAAYVKSKNVGVVNPSSALVSSDLNLLANGSFNSGISGGWTTDTPASVTADSGRNGSHPDPTNSVKFVAGTTNAHLFSPKVTVDSNTTYMLKNYLSVQKLTGGEVGFYIDEYDGFGNWVSGQYKTAERSVFTENLNFAYKPTSANVSKASLQIFATANSGITAYLDNTQWFPLTTTTPPVTPTPTNLIANGTFDAGIGGGWTTDKPTNILADATGKGAPANATNSVKLAAGTTNAHLFSPKVTVDSTKTYSLSSYLNLQTRTSGEVGFYIDEYDANGNWVSGQYKAGVSTIGAGTLNHSYKPTSTTVKTAQLQVIVVANSGITAYFDNVLWTTP